VIAHTRLISRNRFDTSAWKAKDWLGYPIMEPGSWLNNSITGADVKNKSLTAADIKGRLQGPPGAARRHRAGGSAGASRSSGDSATCLCDCVEVCSYRRRRLGGCPLPGRNGRCERGFNTDSDGFIFASSSQGTGWFVGLDTRNGSFGGTVTAILMLAEHRHLDVFEPDVVLRE
jgi:hypothetical protein